MYNLYKVVLPYLFCLYSMVYNKIVAQKCAAKTIRHGNFRKQLKEKKNTTNKI